MIREAYASLMSVFLGYALTNFLWEIWMEQSRYRVIWVSLSVEQQILSNIQMALMDCLLILTTLCIILFIWSLKKLEVF